MADRSDLMKQLLKLEGAVKRDYNPFLHGIQPPSPSLSYTFDNTWMLPFGYSLLLWGEQKTGKSLIARMLAGALHQQDPEAVVLYYNTEMREELQATDQQLALWGIDVGRYQAFNVNEPALIFDPIEQTVPKLIEQGLKIRLIVIDSVSDILGRKMMNATTVDQQLMGDKAQTQQDGLNRIKGMLRRNRIACILTTQARAEMDTTEQMRGKKVKMNAAFAVKHFAEYFCFVEWLRTKEGKMDLTGAEYKDGNREEVKGKSGNAIIAEETNARKIRVTMEGNSCGRAGRTGFFTLDHDKGLINTHEEVYALGRAFGVIQQPTTGRFEFDSKKWHGAEAVLDELKQDPTTYNAVLAGCRALDLARKNVAPAA